MLRNKTRAIEDINISIALADFRVSPLSVQCKLNDIAWEGVLFLLHLFSENGKMSTNKAIGGITMGKTLRRCLIMICILLVVAGIMQGRAYGRKARLRSDALLYFKEEDYKKTIEYLEEGLERKSIFGGNIDQDMRCYLAESYYQMEDYDKAESIYQTLQKKDSGNAIYYLMEGQCCKTSGDYDKAMKIYNKGWKKTKDTAFLSRICEIYIEQKEYDKALDYARQGIGDGGSASAELQYDLIIIYENSQDYEAAYKAAKEYCKNYPDDERAQKELLFLSSRV